MKCIYFLYIFVDLCIYNYLTKERPSVRLHNNVWIFKLVLKYKKVSCCWVILFFYTICFVLLEVQNQYQVSCEIINQIISTFLSWCHIFIPQALDTLFDWLHTKPINLSHLSLLARKWIRNYITSFEKCSSS